MFITATRAYPPHADAVLELLFPRHCCPPGLFLETVQVRVATTRMCRPVHEWLTRTLLFDDEHQAYRFGKAVSTFLLISSQVVLFPAEHALYFPSTASADNIQDVLTCMVAQMEQALPFMDGWDIFYRGRD